YLPVTCQMCWEHSGKFDACVPYCRRKGKLYDHSACLEHQGLACCPWVSRSRRPVTALTEGRPQRSRELGEEGAESARDKTTGVFRMVTGCRSHIPCKARHACMYIDVI